MKNENKTCNDCLHCIPSRLYKEMGTCQPAEWMVELNQKACDNFIDKEEYKDEVN